MDNTGNVEIKSVLEGKPDGMVSLSNEAQLISDTLPLYIIRIILSCGEAGWSISRFLKEILDMGQRGGSASKAIVEERIAEVGLSRGSVLYEKHKDVKFEVKDIDYYYVSPEYMDNQKQFIQLRKAQAMHSAGDSVYLNDALGIEKVTDFDVWHGVVPESNPRTLKVQFV